MPMPLKAFLILFTLFKDIFESGCVCAALTSPHKLPARGYFIDEYYFLSTPCLSALNELSDSIQISPSRKTSMVCCMDYYTTAFKWAFFVESSIKPIVCVRPYDFSRCCECTVLCGILTGFISLQWHTKPAGLLCFMMQFEAKVSMKGRKYFDFLTISWVIVRYFFFLQFEFLVKSSDGFHILAMTHETRGSSLFYDADWSQSLYEKYFHPLRISRDLYSFYILNVVKILVKFRL